MQINFTFRSLEAHEPLKKLIETKLEKLEKFINNSGDVHVTLSSEKNITAVEVSLKAYGTMIKSTEKSPDISLCVDKVVGKIERQLKRKKERIKEKHKIQKTI